MYLWGDNSNGALGSDSVEDPTTPGLVVIEKLKNTEVSGMMLASGSAAELTRTVSGLEPGALYNFYANDDITAVFASDIHLCSKGPV